MLCCVTESLKKDTDPNHISKLTKAYFRGLPGRDESDHPTCLTQTLFCGGDLKKSVVAHKPKNINEREAFAQQKVQESPTTLPEPGLAENHISSRS